MTPEIEKIARAFCRVEGYTHPDEDWRHLRNGVPEVINEVHIEPGMTQRWRNYTRHAIAAMEAMGKQPSGDAVDRSAIAEAIIEETTAFLSLPQYDIQLTRTEAALLCGRILSRAIGREP